jgi:hypothetical protein
VRGRLSVRHAREGARLMGDITLMLGDCLDRMGEIADGSVDLIAADLPYGTTACKWDVVIPFEPLWTHYRRVLKPRGAVVLTASQPFTSMLVMSNREWFKYTIEWHKGLHSNPLNAPYQPLRVHEDICVFSPAASTYSPRGTMTYNPQLTAGEAYRKPNKPGAATRIFRSAILPASGFNASGDRLPLSVIYISGAHQAAKVHRTQKPVPLMEYLIRTYSDPAALVLDNAMGSGTTGVACLNTDRRFIGIEKDEVIFATAARRIAAHQSSTPLLTGTIA